MAEIVNFPDPRNDRAEAEAWLVKLDGDEFSAADARSWKPWRCGATWISSLTCVRCSR